MATKTLLTPLESGIPRKGKDMPSRHRTSFKYQDENGRYFFGSFPVIDLPLHQTDQFYVLEAEDVGRPDLIAYKFYKTPSLYWVILWVNNIIDPFEDMYPGMLLRLPSTVRLTEYNIKG
jgi:hypothetical protein